LPAASVTNYRDLASDKPERNGKDNHTADQDRRVGRTIGIHAQHENQHDHGHRRAHDKRHVRTGFAEIDVIGLVRVELHQT